MTTKEEAPTWLFDVCSCMHPDFVRVCECVWANSGMLKEVSQRQRGTGAVVFNMSVHLFAYVLHFFFFFFYLLRRVSVNQVRHERDLPVHEGGRSQVQWNVVCHHHCDVHSWRNSLNCPTWESTERQKKGGRHVSMSSAENISCVKKIHLKKKSASRREKKGDICHFSSLPAVVGCNPEMMG